MTVTNDEILAHFDFESVEESKLEEPPADTAEETVSTETVDDVAAEEAGPVVTEESSTEEVGDKSNATIYMGKYKTPEDMEAAFREYQSHSDRKLAEEQARREAYEQMLLNEQNLLDRQQAVEAASVTPEQLDNAVKNDPIGTFHWAVNNNPNAVPSVIAKIAEHNDQAMAIEAQTAWTQIQLAAQQQAMAQQMQEAIRPQQVQQSILHGLKMVEDAYGEDFNALRGEVADRLTQLGKLESYDPQTIAATVEYTFLQAHRERALQAASNVSGGAKSISPQDTVETGTPGQVPEVSPDDDIRNAIVNSFNNGFR